MLSSVKKSEKDVIIMSRASGLISLPSLNINHHSLFIIMHDAFDIADPSSTQDACHT